MKQAELKQTLDAHAEWLQDNSKGQRANLSGADLSRANLSGACLSGADLSRANLSDANLSGANLSGANLSGACLSDADLSRANLSDANLSGADLSRADLSRANLSGANLSRANLSRADLSPHSLVPEEGDFVAFKKLVGGKIAKLLIPADAKRVSSLVGRKCRASHALVLEITHDGISDPDGEGISSHDPYFKYKVGETVRAALNDDIRIECTSGIHYFLTRKEAENY